MNKTLSLKNQAIYVFAGKIIALIITFSLPIVLVRLFTQQEYGLYQQAWMISLTAASILEFSIYNSLYYFYPFAKSRRKQSELLSQTFLMIFLIGILFCLAFILFKGFFLSFFDNNSFGEIYLSLALLIFFTLIAYGLQIIFIIEEKAKWAMLYEIINQAVRVAFILAAIFFFGSVKAAMWGLVFHAFIASLFFFIYASKTYNFSVFKIKKAGIINQLKYACPMGLGIVVGTIGEQADKIILTALFTASDYAIYSVGNFRIPIIVMLYASVGNVILPKLSTYSANRDDNNKSLVLWKKMVIKNAMATIPSVIFCSILATPLITFLFGEQYAESATVFRITLLVLVVQMLGHGYVVRAYGNTNNILIANLAKMLFTTSAGYLLIKTWGITGAAVTFLLGFSINAAIQLLKSKQLLEARWRDFFPWKDFFILSAISAAACLPLFLLPRQGLHKAVLLAMDGTVYFVITALLLLKFKYIALPSSKSIKSFLKW